MFVLENLSFKSMIKTRKVGEERRKMDTDPQKKVLFKQEKLVRKEEKWILILKRYSVF